MNPAIDLAFEHNYAIEHVVLTARMLITTQFYFPGATTICNHTGLRVKIEPSDGDEWIGVFEFGLDGITGIFSTPNSNLACIASNGNVFFVDARNPQKYEAISKCAFQIFQLPRLNIILVVDMNGIKAYDEDTLIWDTNDKVHAPFVESVTEKEIKGTGEDCGRPVEFSIDITKGTIAVELLPY